MIIGTACAAGVLLGSLFNLPSHKPGLLSSNSNKQKLERLIDYIDYDYVDKVNTDSIVDMTIARILRDLDPHSTYIPKTAMKDVAEEMDGDFIGIGVQFFKVRDSIAVIRTIENGPSEVAGIKSGDRLVYAGEVPLFGDNATTSSLKNLLRGDENSMVNLKVKRPGQEELLEFEIKRQHIPVKSVENHFMLTTTLGYIKISRFSKNTYSEFEEATKDLKAQNVKDIVLDLRGNGGGYLKEAVKIADEFLKDGELILFTKDNKDKIVKTYATKGGDFEDAKVYVLIDQNSASASEVVAGALQDNDIGLIVGRRSYGKGLVQREMDLGDGSAIRLTVARYFTPTGRSIQKPYKKGDNVAYHHDFIDRVQNGELEHQDSIHVNDSLKFTTPKGKIVYGGGGIVPDVFIPQDLSYRRESLEYMMKGGMIDRFVFNYMDENRAYYSGMDYKEFSEKLVIDNEILDEFDSFLKDFKLNFRARRYENLLKTYIQASMVKQLFDSNTYGKILSTEDEIIQKVIEMDENPDWFIPRTED